MDAQMTTEENCCIDTDILVTYQCQQCRYRLCSTVGLSVLDHPRVRSFYRDHGLDLGAMPYWQLAWCISDEQTTRDPHSRVTLDIPCKNETLELTLDEDLEIVGSDQRV